MRDYLCVMLHTVIGAWRYRHISKALGPCSGLRVYAPLGQLT